MILIMQPSLAFLLVDTDAHTRPRNTHTHTRRHTRIYMLGASASLLLWIPCAGCLSQSGECKTVKGLQDIKPREPVVCSI